MVDSSILLVVRTLAGFCTLALICSPSILMYQIYTQKHVGVASILPLVMLLINSHAWILYGYMTDNYFPIFSCFLFGDIVAVFYLAVYWTYTSEKSYVTRVLVMIMRIFILISIYAIVGGHSVTGQTRAEFGKTLGYLGDVTAICLYASPMEKLFQVLKHKSAVFLNTHMVIASLINNCLWFMYGVLTGNWILIAPNILFIVLNASTLVLCMVYNPKTHPLEGFFDSNDDNPIEVSIELSPKATNSNKVPSPEYRALQSPLELLKLQLRLNRN